QRSMSYILTAVTILLSIAGATPVFWCGMTYTVKENVTVVVYLDDACNVVQKSRSSAVYFLYVIVSLVLTGRTSREFMKLSRMAEDSTRALIMTNQRIMFIIVSICTLTQMIKACHQFCWVFVAAFKMADLNLFLQQTYDITHYLSTYSAAFSLVVFNKKFRKLMISVKLRDPIPSSVHTKTTVVSIQQS
ncbi:hypothetical protein PENTCL1PPCAC_27610, partial [Pristionchus entomophagus]